MNNNNSQQQDEDAHEIEICFRNIFSDNLIFGVILTIVLVIFIILFVFLVMYWKKRRFWFPIQERSTNCTLAFLIACFINFTLQPILLIIYSLNENVYVHNGIIELTFKYLYIFTRFCLTTIYIAKVSRLTFVSQVKVINKVYYFFQSELLVLSAAIFTALIIALFLIINIPDAIHLSIEDGYVQNVSDFWIPLQSIEVMVCSTLILMMQFIAPYYRFGQELVAIFLTNIFISIIQYTLYYNRNISNYHPIDNRTYIVFTLNQIKIIIKIFFCVYYPLSKASNKQIPLPNERELINTVNGKDSLKQFYLILSFYNQDIEEPFINYLKYLDKHIQLQSSIGQNFQSMIDILSQKYPLIKQIKSFNLLYQCYVELSLSLELEDEHLMEKLVHQYITKDLQQNSNTSIQDLSLNNNKQPLFTATFYFNNINSCNKIDQSNDSQNQINSNKNNSFWKKYFYCFLKSSNNTQRRDILAIEQNIKIQIFESFLNKQRIKSQQDFSDILNQSESKKNALIDVKNDLFQYIHILWKEFFSTTKSFSYLRKVFMQYGSTRNHLQKFKLSNQQYYNS